MPKDAGYGLGRFICETRYVILRYMILQTDTRAIFGACSSNIVNSGGPHSTPSLERTSGPGLDNFQAGALHRAPYYPLHIHSPAKTGPKQAPDGT